MPDTKRRKRPKLYTSKAGVHYIKTSEYLESEEGQEDIRVLDEIFPPPSKREEHEKKRKGHGID